MLKQGGISGVTVTQKLIERQELRGGNHVIQDNFDGTVFPALHDNSKWQVSCPDIALWKMYSNR